MSQQNDVQETVKEFVDGRKAFTAFNVTKELRSNGQQAFHRDIRAAVHSIFRQQQMADYQQTTVQPSGFPAPAILYYPPEVDPNDFTGDVITAKVQPTTTVDDDDDDDDSDDDDDEDEKVVVRSLTADGILYIPRWMGRSMNAQPGNVDVEPNRKGGHYFLEVKVGPPSTGKLHAHVDPRKNIRLGKSLLVSLGANWNSYKIEYDAVRILISKVN
jgi:Holliday junction resolvase-like predicted endonuclease